MIKSTFENQRDIIFNQNIGSEVIIKVWSYDYNPKATLALKLKIGKIIGCNTENNPTTYFVKTNEGVTHFEANDLCLLKTYLGDMDDEHAINIARIISKHDFGTKELIAHRLSTKIVVTEKGFDADHNQSVNIRFISFGGKYTLDLGRSSYILEESLNVVDVFQYLQQLGYALPQTIIVDDKPVQYRIEELIELGIYRLKENNG